MKFDPLELEIMTFASQREVVGIGARAIKRGQMRIFVKGRFFGTMFALLFMWFGVSVPHNAVADQRVSRTQCAPDAAAKLCREANPVVRRGRVVRLLREITQPDAVGHVR